MALEASGNIWL